VQLEINGIAISVPAGTTILEAVKGSGIEIPNLCYDKDLTAVGACRLCVVKVEGFRNLPAACSTAVQEGMRVLTEDNEVVEARKTILELMLANHPNDCMTCERTGNCRLQDYCYIYGIKSSPFSGEKKEFPIDSVNHLIERDHNKCILCGKCVRVCSEVQVINATEFTDRGFYTKVTTPFDKPLDTDYCRFCGQCIEMCPTGALINKQIKGTRPWEIKKVRTTCPFCGTGCNFDLNIKDGKVIGVSANENSPVNGRALCVKGRFHTDLIYSPDRVTKPLIREKGVLKETTWEKALNYVAENLSRIKAEYGPDSIAALSSARCTIEDNYIMQKFMRAVVGTNNVDHCART